MPEGFGARMRQHRERQAIDLAAVAAQTKIKASLLEALERDEVSHWPTGIFRRSFIRAYATAIHLDPEPVVREFLEFYPDPNEEAASLAALATATDGAQASGAPPMRLRYLVGSAIESLSRYRHGSTANDLSSPKVAPPGAVLSIAVAPSREIGPANGNGTPPVDQENQKAEKAPSDSKLVEAARLCTEFGRSTSCEGIAPLLADAANLLDATGLIVWIWQPDASELRPALAHGYPDHLIARLPAVKRDATNATAAALRSGEPQTVIGPGGTTGALAVPLMTPAGCTGVLAFELRHGHEPSASVRALATFLAAPLSRLLEAPRPAASDRRLA